MPRTAAPKPQRGCQGEAAESCDHVLPSSEDHLGREGEGETIGLVVYGTGFVVLGFGASSEMAGKEEAGDRG